MWANSGQRADFKSPLCNPANNSYSLFIPFISATDQGHFSVPMWSATIASITVFVTSSLVSDLELSKVFTKKKKHYKRNSMLSLVKRNFLQGQKFNAHPLFKIIHTFTESFLMGMSCSVCPKHGLQSKEKSDIPTGVQCTTFCTLLLCSSN